MKKEPRKFSYTIITGICAIALNMALSIMCENLHLPLYLNSIGVIFASAAGGILTGVVTGFLTTFLMMPFNPLAIYYGVILVTIALFTSLFTKTLGFRSIKNTFFFTLGIIIYDTFSVTFLSWFLYNRDISIGAYGMLAVYLNENVFNNHPFYSLALSVLATTTVDKIITIAICFILLNCLPKRFMNIFPYGYIFMIDRRDAIKRKDYYLNLYKTKQRDVKFPLRRKVLYITIGLSVLFGLVGGIIGIYEFTSKNLDYYNLYAENSLDLITNVIDIDDFNSYIKDYEEGKELPDKYYSDKSELIELKKSLDLAESIHIVKATNEGFEIIMDIENEDSKLEVGEIISYNKKELEQIDDIKQGNNLEFSVSKRHGAKSITNYMPLKDNNEFVGYIMIDLRLDDFMFSNYVYSIKIISLLFAISIIVSCLLYEGTRLLVLEPVIEMAELSNDFSINTDLSEYIEKMNDIKIYTRDEVLELYESIKHMTSMIRSYTQDLKDKNEYIEKFSENLIEILAVMSESRDTSTGEHIRRTSLFVKEIAKRLSLNSIYKDYLTEERINVLYKASPLHDIGKIQISDVILNKPGKLTSDEFEVMKTHTVKGKEILERALIGIESNEFLNVAITLSLYHHERWDGSGYPYGISGEDIPIDARIMAVADVFDALISKRVYKDAYSLEDALEIMEEENGKHFDPIVYKAFTDSLMEIKQIIKDN